MEKKLKGIKTQHDRKSSNHRNDSTQRNSTPQE